MVGIVSIILFGESWLGWILFILWIIRILALKNKLVTLITTILVVIFVFIGIINLQNTQKKQRISNNQTELNLKVYPDEIKSSDNSFYGTFESQDSGEKYLASGNDYKKISSINYPFILHVKGEVKGIDGATNFNQFDAKSYYQSLGVFKKLTIKNMTISHELSKKSIVNYIHFLRMRGINYFNTLPHPLNLYANSLFLGEMDGSFNDELTGIKSLGLIHLFSISGLHVYYIVSLMTLILVKLRITKEKINIILLILLPTYFILAGSSIGLLRSIISVEIGLLFKLFSKRSTALDTWSITFIVNLMMQPTMLLQFGCQLSYALAFGLIFTSRMKTIKQTIMMNLVSLPIIIYKLFTWHLLTMLANYLVIPIFSSIIMPIILIAIVVSPISYWIPQLVAWFLELFDVCINYLGGLPGNIVMGKPHIIVTLILFICTLWVIAETTKRKLLILFMLYLLTFMWIHFPISGEVSFFDVGQGDSALVREPFNKSVNLIDTGGKLQFGRKTPVYQADKISVNYLYSIGIDYVDNLALSHQDTDHVGDTPIILQKLKVKNLIIDDGMQNNGTFMQKVRPYLKNTKLITVKAGNKVKGFPFEIYHPFKPGLGSNEDSMVLSTQQGQKRWLFMGDLPSNGEKDIIHKYPQLKTDVLKLGHHGSNTSSSNEFLKFLHPELSVISAGRNNRYHHPSKETLEKLNSNGLKYVNTQNQGMISYRYGLFGKRFTEKLQGDNQ